MKKMKAAGLILGLVVALSVMTVGSPKFNYYLISQAAPGHNTNCLALPPAACDPFQTPAHISGTDPRVTYPGVGANGISRYFQALNTAGLFALAPF